MIRWTSVTGTKPLERAVRGSAIYAPIFARTRRAVQLESKSLEDLQLIRYQVAKGTTAAATLTLREERAEARAFVLGSMGMAETWRLLASG